MTNNRDAIHPGQLDVKAVEKCSCPFCGSAISAAMKGKVEAKVRQLVASAELAARDSFLREQGPAAKKAADEIASLNATLAEKIDAARRDAVKQAEKGLSAKVGEAVNEERKKAFAEKLALEQQLDDMKRRLQSQTAHQLGEPAEVDLHASLRRAFPQDTVTRVPKGSKGADVIVEVINIGRMAGKLIIDSKNHRRWSNKFTQKLRADQLEANADFAILSSSAFPSGKEQIHVQDNVIVAHPDRVVVIVELLRRVVIQTDLLKLNGNEHEGKADQLLEFMTSQACWNCFEDIAKLSAEIEDIDRAETAQHHKTWAKRAEAIQGLALSYQKFAGSIDSILGSLGAPDAGE